MDGTFGSPRTAPASIGVFDCALPAAGQYRLDVTAASPATAYTTIDSVTTAECGPAIALNVGNAATPIDSTHPGASSCVAVNATAGDVLAFKVNGPQEQSLIRLYARRCSSSVSAVGSRARPTGNGRASCLAPVSTGRSWPPTPSPNR